MTLSAKLILSIYNSMLGEVNACFNSKSNSSNVSIDNSTISETKQGLLILVCAMNEDNEEDVEKMA